MTKPRKVVAFGGGSAMPAVVLPGLKEMGLNIVTAASMTDSGGSTGALRREFNVHAMGDIRRHILALSEAEDWKKALWKFRFANDITFDDSHKGHNFANVFMAGLEKITDDYEKTLEITHDFMKVKGLCFPATLEKIQLFAELENGEIVKGEDDIDVPRPNHDTTIPIKRIWLEPEAKGYPPLIKAIAEADFIVIGPGDLYSSLLPCFVPAGIKEAIQKSSAKIIYICNLLAKPGESYKFTASDHAKKICEYIGREKIDYFLAASEKIGEDFIAKNPELKQYSPVKIDMEAIETNPMDASELSKVLAKIIND